MKVELTVDEFRQLVGLDAETQGDTIVIKGKIVADGFTLSPTGEARQSKELANAIEGRMLRVLAGSFPR